MGDDATDINQMWQIVTFAPGVQGTTTGNDILDPIPWEIQEEAVSWVEELDMDWEDASDVEKSTWLQKHGDEIVSLMGWADIKAQGKGDVRRPPQVDKQTYDKNWNAVFGDKRKHVCREFVRDKQGVSRCYHCDEPQEAPF